MIYKPIIQDLDYTNVTIEEVLFESSADSTEHIKSQGCLHPNGLKLYPFQYSSSKKLTKPKPSLHPTKSSSISKVQSRSGQRGLETPEKTHKSYINLYKSAPSNAPNKYPASSLHRWEMLYEYSSIKQYKIDYARKLSQENEIKDKECTFRPMISSIKKNKDDLVTRTYSWLKDRNKKIGFKVAAEFDKDLVGCTFTPKITGIKTDSGESLEGIKGISMFLRRQNAARSNLSLNKAESHDPQPKAKDLTPKEYQTAVKGLNEYLHSLNIQ